VLVAAPSGTPFAPATAQASSAIQIITTRAYTDSIGYLHVVGYLKNVSSYWREFVRISGRFYNSSGVLLKTDFTYTFLDLVAPNGGHASFDLLTKKPSGYDHYRLSTSSYTTSHRPIHNLSIIKGQPYTDSIGYHHYIGEVHNGNTFKITFVMVVVTVFDSNGRILNTDFTFTDPYTLSAGHSEGFDCFMKHVKGAATVRYQVQADRY
jgi:hypothetical protein